MSDQERKDMVTLVGVKADGTEHVLGQATMPPKMKARELVQTYFGQFDGGDDDDSDGAMAYWAACELIDWMEKQGGVKVALTQPAALAQQAVPDGWKLAIVSDGDTQPQAVEDEREALRDMLDRLERQAKRFGELWERCQGKGWPEAESVEFHAIRDERLPKLRAEIVAWLARPAGEVREPLTDEQIEVLRKQDDCGEDAPEFARIIRIAERAHGIGKDGA